MIEFKDVTVRYEADSRYPVHAVEGFSLRIEPGEWVFLVGPSGAGKSTLLKLLHCGVTASEGRVTVEGCDITHLPPREVPLLRRKVGVVFQDFQLLEQKSAWENVAFALRVIGTPQSRLVREVPRALDTVGLTHKAHLYPHQLSGGEQQRIAIARAIVNNPTVLLADEPTGNLNPKTSADITQVLRTINEERGTTVLMVTHDREIVDAMRQRVVRLSEGRLASDEKPGIYHPEDMLSPARAAPLLPPPEPIIEPARPPQSSEPESSNDQAENYLAKVRRNQAPMGSSENPIIQFDTVPPRIGSYHD